MGLFKAVLSPTSRGQLQEVFCPRCKTVLSGKENSTSLTGEGVGLRKVTGEYECSCNYKVTVVETYPVIQRAEERE